MNLHSKKLETLKAKKLVNVAKGVQFDETEEDKKINQQINKDFSSLIKFVKDSLKGIVSDVKLNRNLIDDACIVTSSAFGVSINQEKIYRAQTMGESN